VKNPVFLFNKDFLLINRYKKINLSKKEATQKHFLLFVIIKTFVKND